MPRTKKTETEVIVPAEPKTRRTPAGPKTTTAVNHKHTTKKPVPEAVVMAAPVAPAKIVAQEEIAKLAYSYWVARGCQGGSQHDDWYQAEQQLKG